MTERNPPPGERALGLGFYVTSTEGFDGRLKSTAEDFRVQEISLHPVPDEDGSFTVLRVASRNWEQHELAQRLAAALGIPPHSIRWAGTKDRRAVSERLASYRGTPPRGPVSIPGVEVREVYRARDGLVLGHHYGNAFEIRLAVSHETGAESLHRAESTRTALRSLGGFANLFGLQRFGEVRPVTHEVGRLLVRGDVAGAVEAYLVNLPEGDTGPGAEARRAYATHHDPVRALREFPPYFRFERQMLDHLARGNPPERALRALSRELRLLFIHAYQSWLFNRWMTARHRAGLSLNEPVEGDVVLRVARDGTIPGTGPAAVDATNLAECQDAVRRQKARLAGPLVGFEPTLLSGEPGALFSKILEEESVQGSDFALPQTPEISSRGTWRPTWVELPPVDLAEECRGEGSPDAEHGLWFRFSLPKGSYATVLLREFLKAGAS